MKYPLGAEKEMVLGLKDTLHMQLPLRSPWLYYHIRVKF